MHIKSSGVLLVFIVVNLLSISVLGDSHPHSSDPVAMKICDGTKELRFECYRFSKSVSFQREALMVCGDLSNHSAQVKCLYLVRDEIFNVDDLKRCDDEKSDWNVLDCLKAFSTKPQAELDVRFFIKMNSPVWSVNYQSPSALFSSIQSQVSNKGIHGGCSGYRYIEPANPKWRTWDCWSTRYYFLYGPPDPNQSGRFFVGTQKYNHCLVNLKCTTD